MINNRQAGRRRGRGGGNNGQRPGGNPGRPDNGNRIDNRARGNANQLYEKYKNLASEAQRQGDRVNTEYYLQFADHYFRVLNESRSRFEEQNQRRVRDDAQDDGFDGQDEDYGDEGEPIRPGEMQGDVQGGGFEPRRQRDDRPRREDRPQRDDRPQREARDDRSNRDERPYREERAQREDRPVREAREDRPAREAREDRPVREAREDRPVREPREDRPQREERRPARPLRAPVAEETAVVTADPAGEPAVAEQASAPVAEAEAPRRRGRPRREPVAQAPEAETGFDADRLPPALSAASEGEAPAPEEKPRRRRVRAAAPEVTPAS